MQTIKHPLPKISAVGYMIPGVFALFVFFFGFTDLPRLREEAFPLFGLLLAIVLLAIPVAIGAGNGNHQR